MITKEELFVYSITLIVLLIVVALLINMICDNRQKLKYRNTSIKKVNKEINKRINKMNRKGK
jgi:hypothetical protein